MAADRQDAAASPKYWGAAVWVPQLSTLACGVVGGGLLALDPAIGTSSVVLAMLVAGLAAGVLVAMIGRRMMGRALQPIAALVGIRLSRGPRHALDFVAERVADSVRSATERKALLDSIIAAVPGCVYRLESIEPNNPMRVRVALISRGLDAATGLSREHLLDKGLMHWILPTDRARVEAELHRHLRERQPWCLEYRVCSPTGQVAWVRDNGVATYDESGRLLHADGVLTNATASIAQSRRAEMLRAALDSSSSEVLLIRPSDLRVRYANAGARRNLCLEPVDHLLPTLVDCPVEELRQLVVRAAAGEECAVHWRCMRFDGSSYPLEGTVVAVGEGDDQGLLIVGVNVAERERQEVSLRESEERLRLMVEASQDGVLDVDLRRQIVFVSPRAAGMLQLPEEHGGVLPYDATRALDLLHADDRAQIVDALQQYAVGRTDSVDCEPRVRCGDGYRWLRARGRGQWDEQGRLTRLTLCLSDITQQRVSEAILRDTVSRLGAVLEHVAEGIVTFDAAGLIRSFNPAAESIFGWTQEETLDRSIDTLVPIDRGHDDWDVAYARLQRLGDAVGVRRSGARMPVEIGVTRLVAAGQELYTAIVRDISERKRVEEELRAARDTAESSLRAKSEFLAVMSHEIRTPLNGVLGMTQLLSESELTLDQRETVRMIHRSGEALLSIINDVLDYSKIEAGRMQMEQAPFSLRDVVRDVFDLVGVRVRDQAIELVLDYDNAVPRHVIGDATRMRQVLLNLVGNAVKFTERGHVVVAVRECPGVGGEATMLEITVEDSGIGIDPGIQARLFTAFTQADASTTRRFGGTGLGLAICKQLVDLMGGDLSVRSVPGVGSVFVLRLSFRRVVADTLLGAPGGVVPEVREAPVGQDVLLLLSYRRQREVVERDLRALGCRVTRVQSLEDLWLHRDRNAVFVVDRSVLGLDTTSFAWTLRERGRRAVLLTPPFGDGDRNELCALGFSAVLAKPVGVDELAAALSCGVGDAISAVPDAVAPPVDRGRLCVLVADDNTVNQRVAMRMLERLGCEVLLADDGDAALRCWRERTPDLVLMDVRMPVMDGLAATEAIRAEERRAGKVRTPIVGISANSSVEDEQRCRTAGMDDFVPKPIRTSGLQRVIAVLRDAASAPDHDQGLAENVRR